MTRPKLAHSNPADPALHRLHEELTALGRILPVSVAPPAPPKRPVIHRAEPVEVDFSDVDDLFDNCPI